MCVCERVCAYVFASDCVWGVECFVFFGFWVTSRCVCPWVVFVCCAMCVCVCLCVCERERKRESVCVFEYLYV